MAELERYKRNKNLILDEEQEQLANKKVCILGAGGLGGYLAEMSLRLGVESITIIDQDVFEASNLNRQLYSVESNLSQPKVEEAKKRLKAINSKCEVNAIHTTICTKNLISLLSGHDIILDGLDDRALRKEAVLASMKLNIPFIHGAVAAWYGQVAVLLPNGKLYNEVFKNANNKGIEKETGVPVFIVANVASCQISEMLKVLANPTQSKERLIVIDLKDNEMNCHFFK